MADNNLVFRGEIRPDTRAMDSAVRRVEADVSRIGQKTRAASNNINISNFGAAQRPLGKLVGLATEFEKSMEAANARVLAFGASVGVIVGVKNAFVALVREALLFNDEMIKINSVLGVSSATLDKFGDNLFNIAQRTAQSIREVNQAALEFSRQGLGMEETLKRTESAMILTRLAGISAADATKKLTAAVNSFKSEGIDVTNVLDRIVKVEQAFAVDTNDLTSAIERAGSTATAAGVKFNDFLGIVTAIQEKTSRGGAVIGNAVKTIFSRLQSESRLANLEGILNIKLFDEKDQPLQMVDRIKKIAMELKKVTDPLKRERALFEIAGTYQKNIGEALISDVQAGKDSVLVRSAENAQNSAGSAAQKNSQLNQSLIAQFDRIIEKVKEIGVTLADLGTTDLIQSLLSFANTTISAFDGLLNRTDAIGGGFKNLAKGLSSLLGPAGLIGIVVVGKFFFQFVKFAKESVQSLLHVNNVSNKQKIIEGEINAILGQDAALRSQILSGTMSQVEIDKQLNAVLAARIKMLENQSKIVAASSLNAATSGQFSAARGGGLTTKITDDDIRKVGVVRAATGLSVQAAMETEEKEKFLGGARASDAARAIPIRTSGGSMATGVVNASEKVVDVPGFGTVVMPRNELDKAVAKDGISKEDMYRVVNPSKTDKLGITSSELSPIRSTAIRDLVDGYITSGLLGFKGKNNEVFDYSPEMLAAIRGDKKKSSIFFDLFGHFKDMYAGDRKTYGDPRRDNINFLDKLVRSDPAIKAEYATDLEAGLRMFLVGGGKATASDLVLGQSFKKAYTLAQPTSNDATAMQPPELKIMEAPFGRITNAGSKGLGALGGILSNIKKRIVGNLPPTKQAEALEILKRYKPQVRFPSIFDRVLTPEAAIAKAQKDPKFSKLVKDVDVQFGQLDGTTGISKKGNRTFGRQQMIVKKPGFYGNDEVQNYALGRMPNFAFPETSRNAVMLGSGVEGSFYQYGKKDAEGNLIGTKKFKTKGFRKADLIKEYLISKLLSTKSLVAGITAPKIYGSIERSLAQRRIGKSVIKDPLGETSLGPPLSRRLGFYMRSSLERKGLDMRDLHGGNYTINQAGIDFLKRPENHNRVFGNKGYGLDEQEMDDLFKQISAAGGKITIIDAGRAFPSGSVSSELKSLSSSSGYKGRLPNFADPLRAAMQREMAAGVPANKIYIDKHSSLKSAYNPQGLMVANRIDEPLGGYQGIARARAEGADPKTYGIPNYAENVFKPQDRFGKNGKGEMMGEYAPMLNQEVGKLVKGLQKGTMTLAQANAELAKIKSAFQLSSASLKKVNDNFNNAINDQKRTRQVTQTEVKENRKRAFATQNQGTGYRSTAGLGYTAMPTVPMVPRGQTPWVIPAANPNPMGMGALPARTGTTLAQQTQRGPGMFNRMTSGYRGLSDSTKMMAGFGLSMGLPAIGAAIDSSYISKGRERRDMSEGERMGSSAITEGLGYATMGFMIGGPAGAAIGAVAGLGMAASKSALSLEELDASIQERRNKFQEKQSGAANSKSLINVLSDDYAKDIDKMDAKNSLDILMSKDPVLASMFNGQDLENKSQREALIKRISKYESQIAKDTELKSQFPGGEKNKEVTSAITKEFLMESKEKKETNQKLFSMVGLMSDQTLNNLVEQMEQAQAKGYREGGDIMDITKMLASEKFGKNSNEAFSSGVFAELFESLNSSFFTTKKDEEYLLQLIKQNIERVTKSRIQPKLREVEQEDLRTGQDKLRGFIFKSGVSSRVAKQNNEIINRIESIQLEINEVLFTALDDQQALIRGRGAAALSSAARDFSTALVENVREKINFLAQAKTGDFGDLTPKQLRTEFVEPAESFAKSGDVYALNNLLSGLSEKILPYAPSEQEIAVKENIQSLIESTVNLIKNNELQKLEIQTRTLLNSSLAESEKKLKMFIQGVNEAQAQFNYNRIGRGANMEIGLNRAQYGASRFVAAPWEIDANNLKVEEDAARKRSAFAVEGIRGNVVYEAKRLLAQQSNTMAIQNLTSVLMDFLNQKRVEILGADVKDVAERAKIQSRIEGMSTEELKKVVKKGEDYPVESPSATNEISLAFEQSLAEFELKRRQTQSLQGTSVNKIISGDNTFENIEAIRDAAEKIRQSGGELSRDNVAGMVGGDLGTLIKGSKPEEWAALWEAISTGAFNVQSELSNLGIVIEGINDRYADANKNSYYMQARAQAEQGLKNNINDLANMPGTTPDQMVEALQALKRFQTEDPFGKFADGMELAFARMETETMSFANQLGQNIPNLFRDNMAAAISDITMGTKSIKDALLGAAASFFGELNKAFSQQASNQLTSAIGGYFGLSTQPQKYASGGRVRGGSGVRDDVPAILTGGEYVVKRSAAQKYGTGFLDSLNSGKVAGFSSGGSVGGSLTGAVVTGALSQYFSSQISSPQEADELKALMTLQKYGKQAGPEYFIPGVNTPDGKYQGAIAGPQNLLNFGRQGYTTGRQDIISGSGEDMSIRLEDESLRLGIQGRLNSDISQEVYGAKEQALGLYYNWQQDQLRVREEEKAQADAQKQQLISSIVGSVVTAGVSAGAAGFSGAYTQSSQAGGGFFQNVGAGIGGIWSGAQGFGGISNIPNGTGFQTYGGRAIDISTGQPYTENGVSSSGGYMQSGFSGPQPALPRSITPRTSSSSNINFVPENEYLPEEVANSPRSFGGDFGKESRPGESFFKNLENQTFDGLGLVKGSGSFGANPIGEIQALQRELGLTEEEILRLGDGLLPPIQEMDGGHIKGRSYMKGGSVPAMVNSGEYIMNSGAASKIGKSTMSKINRGVMPMMSGGEIGQQQSSTSNADKLLLAVEKLDETTRKPEINITINIDKDGATTETKTSKNEKEEERKLADKIKAAVQKAIVEEKRQGGMLK